MLALPVRTTVPSILTKSNCELPGGKLYVSPNTGVSNWREIDNPRYSDFWSQNIEIKGRKIQNGTYKGEDYRYVILRKTVALYFIASSPALYCSA